MSMLCEQRCHDPMFRILISFLSGARSASREVASESEEPQLNGLTIKSLWNDFERKTYQFSYRKKPTQKSNDRLWNWIGSIDRSGFIREKCLRHLISNYVPGDENRILLRLTDWVPQVRLIASEWAAANFRNLPLDSIRENQQLFLYLSRKTRSREDHAMAKIQMNLLDRVQAMTVEDFNVFEPSFRRFLFTLSLEQDQGLRDWIIRDKDPFNRLLLLTHPSIAVLTTEESERLSRDISVRVRRRFALSLLSKGLEIPRDQLTDFAMDQNHGLRNFGQYYLMHFHGVDAYQIYKSLTDDRFYCIADYAKKEDSDHFFAGISSGSNRVKLICLKALVATDESRLSDLDLARLIRVNRRTKEIISRVIPRLLTVEQIIGLRHDFECGSTHGALMFLRVLETKSFWAFLDIALDHLNADAPQVLSNFITETIRAKVEMYEKLPCQHRSSILTKLEKLKSISSRRHDHLVSQIAFMVGRA